MMRLWVVIAAFNGLSAVGFGAWASHGLTDLPAAAALVGTAAQYQMWHALALIGVAWLSDDPGVPGGVIGTAGVCFTLGILLFSGSLFTLALEGVPLFPMSAPAGGILLMAGWVALGLAGLLRR
ncbi:MAG: DUF423 domain-containing protein [Alphaproteobacteria bacterium]